MDKIKSLIPASAFVIYLAKCLFIGASQTDAAIILFLSGLMSYFEFKFERIELKRHKEDISSLKESIREQDKRIEELKTHVGGIKIGQGIRTR